MQILKYKISREDIFRISEVVLDDSMVKAVVDVGRRLVAIDAPMHSDLEQMMLEDGSRQEDLWGINFHSDDDEFVEFDSLINIRPRQNKHMYVDDADTRKLILEVVDEWISQI